MLACKRSSKDQFQIMTLLLQMDCYCLENGLKVYMESTLLHLICICNVICLIAYKIIEHYMLFGFFHLRDTMVYLVTNQQNNCCTEMQLMNRFIKANHYMELIHLAETMPLFDDFGPCVSRHAKSFHSTDILVNIMMLLTLIFQNQQSILVKCCAQMKLKSYKKVTAHIIPKVNQILKRRL